MRYVEDGARRTGLILIYGGAAVAGKRYLKVINDELKIKKLKF